MPGFDDVWEHALDQGFDALYRLHDGELGADPVFQRAMQRIIGLL